MKKLFTLLILLTCKICIGQNLVPNPSFEIYSGCPNSVDQIDSATGWTSFSWTPDYFNTCAASGLLTNVPNTMNGYQQPSTGNAFAGMICYATTMQYREFIGCQLSSPLLIGTTYYISFKVNMAYGGSQGGTTIVSNKLGIKCSTIPYSSSNLMPTDNNPNFYTNSFITDTVNWITVSGSFIADSAYQYMALGNFFDNAHTDTIHLTQTPFRCYYFVDDVCLSTDSLTCNSSVGIQQIKQNNEVKLFPNPFSNQLTFTLANNEPTTIILYDFLSQQIFEKSFTSSTTINTELLADGIYFYQLRNSKRIIANGKVIKQ